MRKTPLVGAKCFIVLSAALFFSEQQVALFVLSGIIVFRSLCSLFVNYPVQI